MYSNRFVISVLVNGQVQKEFANGECHLAFGSEYAIRFRNKNDRRAVVKLYIDGEKMCRGGFVIPANSYRDIECSSQTLRKFKFVDLDSTEAQDHGKDQDNVDKKMGLIEAHWYLEKERPKPVKEVHHYHPYPVPQPYPYWPYTYGATLSCCDSAGGASAAGDVPAGGVPISAPPPADLKCCSMPNMSMGFAAAESVKGACAQPKYKSMARAVKDGATVEGGHSNQRFGECDVDIEETVTILKLYLRGFQPKQEEASEVQDVPATGVNYCDKCGAKALKKSSNFCHVCGGRF